MKLSELRAGFRKIVDGVSEERPTAHDANALLFDCPCDLSEDGRHRILLPITPGGCPPYGSSAPWERTGETLETLTLRPSVWNHCEHGKSGRPGWHGFITDGEARSC